MNRNKKQYQEEEGTSYTMEKKVSLNLIRKIISEKKNKLRQLEFDDIYGVPRGGLIPAVMLSNIMDIPLTLVPSKRTLIVDDLIESGKTLQKYPKQKKFVLFSKQGKKHNVIIGRLIKPSVWLKFFWEE